MDAENDDQRTVGGTVYPRGAQTATGIGLLMTLAENERSEV
jgi:hypothetical protein